MDIETRRAVVEELSRLAGSADYRDRADAGQAMARFVDMPEASQPLQGLLLDAADTFVTHATAEALLRREDAEGLTTVVRALASAGANHADWIYSAAHHVFEIYANQRDTAVQMCNALIEEADPGLRRGAAQLRDVLIQIKPVLHPAGGN
ncbi:hypothetical protein AB0F81_27530 [Actinoplanes sp. NPDC024001]|uniref:hypothetical protein n=1 Tax=Actinoplanes sp. NPDC024001 TaxID=3154598 RepID=UPI0033EC22AA